MRSFYYLPVKAGPIIAISIGFFLFSCIYDKSGSKKGNDLSEMDLTGKVKSVNESVYDAESKKGDGNLNRQIHLFDKKGRKLEERYFWRDTILSSRTAYKYDAYGCLVETRVLDNEGFVSSRIIYKYDEHKNLYQRLELNHLSNLVYRETYTYDRKKYVIEKYIYRPSRSEWNIIFRYDRNGNLNKISFDSIYGGSVMKIFYRNDKKGNKIEEKYLKPDGSIGTMYTHKYDAKGNRTETILYNPADKIINTTVFSYDKNGKLIETRTGLSEDDMKPDQIYKYDEGGHLTEEIITHGLGLSRVAYEYLFDEKGNWLKKTTTKYSQQTGTAASQNIIERVIEYY